MEPKPGRYRHFKGGEYRVLGIARHSEGLEPMVVYRPLYGEGGLWVRPVSMFVGEVEHQGVIQPRFAFIAADVKAAPSASAPAQASAVSRGTSDKVVPLQPQQTAAAPSPPIDPKTVNLAEIPDDKPDFGNLRVIETTGGGVKLGLGLVAALALLWWLF